MSLFIHTKRTVINNIIHTDSIIININLTYVRSLYYTYYKNIESEIPLKVETLSEGSVNKGFIVMKVERAVERKGRKNNNNISLLEK